MNLNISLCIYVNHASKHESDLVPSHLQRTCFCVCARIQALACACCNLSIVNSRADHSNEWIPTIPLHVDKLGLHSSSQFLMGVLVSSFPLCSTSILPAGLSKEPSVGILPFFYNPMNSLQAEHRQQTNFLLLHFSSHTPEFTCQDFNKFQLLVKEIQSVRGNGELPGPELCLVTP